MKKSDLNIGDKISFIFAGFELKGTVLDLSDDDIGEERVNVVTPSREAASMNLGHEAAAPYEGMRIVWPELDSIKLLPDPIPEYDIGDYVEGTYLSSKRPVAGVITEVYATSVQINLDMDKFNPAKTWGTTRNGYQSINMDKSTITVHIEEEPIPSEPAIGDYISGRYIGYEIFGYIYEVSDTLGDFYVELTHCEDKGAGSWGRTINGIQCISVKISTMQVLKYTDQHHKFEPGQKVYYDYDSLPDPHFGIIQSVNNERATIEVDKSYHPRNTGTMRSGKKLNFIKLTDLRRHEMKKISTAGYAPKAPRGSKKKTSGTMSTAAANAMAHKPLQVGDEFRFLTYDEFSGTIGLNPEGYPNTTVAFHTEGGMDHLYGASGTITKIINHTVELAFNNESTGKRYDWGYSLDMIKRKDGLTLPSGVSMPSGANMSGTAPASPFAQHTPGEPSAPHIPEPEPITYRKFLPFNKSPSSVEIWKELMKIADKEKLSPSAPALLFLQSFIWDETTFRKTITESEILTGWTLDMDIQKTISNIVDSVYEGKNLQEFTLVYAMLVANTAASSEAIIEVKKIILNSDNIDLTAEFSEEALCTPIKRLDNNYMYNAFHNYYENLEIRDSILNANSNFTKNELIHYLASKARTELDKHEIYKIEDETVLVIEEL